MFQTNLVFWIKRRTLWRSLFSHQAICANFISFFWPPKILFVSHNFERSDLTYHLNIIISATPVGVLVQPGQRSWLSEDFYRLRKPVVYVVMMAQEVRIFFEWITWLFGICLLPISRTILTLIFVFRTLNNHLQVLVIFNFILLFILLLLLLLLLLLIFFCANYFIFVDIEAPSVLKIIVLIRWKDLRWSMICAP